MVAPFADNRNSISWRSISWGKSFIVTHPAASSFSVTTIASNIKSVKQSGISVI
jgi:hypothetical protein